MWNASTHEAASISTEKIYLLVYFCRYIFIRYDGFTAMVWLNPSIGAITMVDALQKNMHKNLLILLGWFFILLSAIGLLLPILPTTPFLILALALFANSSPKFHQMLLNNRWFGPILKQWEENKTVTRSIKVRAILLVLISFPISIFLVREVWMLQIMLLTIASILLFYIWRLKEDNHEERGN